MKLIDVALHNFGPYYGNQTLSFGKSRPIVVIHGENMRGKTSFLNAIRWGLYGKALNRFGQPMNLLQLINFDAVDQKDWTMSVELTFMVDDLDYTLTRAIQLHRPSIKPSKDSDFEEKLFLKKGNNHLDPDEAQTEINRIFPYRISRFFLFDGELLNEYEVLLSQVEKQSMIIKDSIEQILGVPSITNSIADIKINLRDAGKRQQGLATKDTAARKYAQDAADLASEIDIHEFDLQELRKQRDELTIKQRGLNDELLITAGIEADAKRLVEFEKQKKTLKEEEKSLLEDRRTKLVDAWRDLLQPRIQSRLAVLELESEQQVHKLREHEKIKSKLADKNAMLVEKRCPTCNQPLITANWFELEQSKAELEKQLSLYIYDEEKYTRAKQSIRNLRQLKPASVSQAIKFLEIRLAEVRINIVDLEGKIDDLNDRLKNYDYSTVIRNRLEYEKVTKEIGSLDLIIERSEEMIESKKTDETRLRAKIIQASGPEMDRANREVEIYEDLKVLFERTLNRLRNDLRTFVQDDASAIFLKLTTDKTYTGLRINDYYGLTILDAHGNEVPVRSAGAEQIVALSLIGALNHNAVRQGPIVMDTPFGRLDPKHRENILRFIPTLSSQVTLLVHSGEINREKDLEPIIDMIDKEYEIISITSRQSRIISLKEM